MNLLYVSIAFPPKNAPESLQAARNFKYLRRHWSGSIDVITSSIPTLYMPRDRDLIRYVEHFENIFEVPIPELKYTNFIMRKLGVDLVNRPDSKFLFHWQWKRVLKKLTHKPDIIYSRSQPMSSSVMALKIKEHLNIPWICHWSDPWYLSPLSAHQNTEYHKRMERSCVINASQIHLTTREAVQLYRDYYPDFAEKFHYFPNTMDFEQGQEVNKPENQKMRIVYTGGLSGSRNPDVIIEMLSRFDHRYPEQKDRYEFIFAGPMDRNIKARFKKYDSNKIKHLGQLTYDQSLELQRSADVLLILDSPGHAADMVFMPSKLLDYAPKNGIIWAITPAGGACDNVIIRHELGVTNDHKDYTGMLNTLGLLLDAWEKDKLYRPMSSTFKKEFDSEVNALRLIDCMQQTLKS